VLPALEAEVVVRGHGDDGLRQRAAHRQVRVLQQRAQAADDELAAPAQRVACSAAQYMGE
jgi:hypothetical protein